MTFWDGKTCVQGASRASNYTGIISFLPDICWKILKIQRKWRYFHEIDVFMSIFNFDKTDRRHLTSWFQKKNQKNHSSHFGRFETRFRFSLFLPIFIIKGAIHSIFWSGEPPVGVESHPLEWIATRWAGGMRRKPLSSAGVPCAR